MTHDFVYSAHVDSVYDGDTITCSIDLGFGVVMRKQKIRLFGINTPEVRGVQRPEGLKSRDALRERILDKDITLKTIRDKKGKYGRYLGIIFINDENINDWLVASGLAKTASY